MQIGLKLYILSLIKSLRVLYAIPLLFGAGYKFSVTLQIPGQLFKSDE